MQAPVRKACFGYKATAATAVLAFAFALEEEGVFVGIVIVAATVAGLAEAVLAVQSDRGGAA